MLPLCKKGQVKLQSREGATERIVSRCPGLNKDFIKNRESETRASLIKCTFGMGWTGVQISNTSIGMEFPVNVDLRTGPKSATLRPMDPS